MGGDCDWGQSGWTWANDCTSTTYSTWGSTTGWLDYTNQKCSWKTLKSMMDEYIVERIPDKLPAGARTLELPDGAKLIVDDLGNYRIEDKDAKVTYKANRIREFSPYLNASDMLAEFVRYVGTLGVKRGDVLGLPIQLFIAWLIIESAEKDGDEIPADVIPVAHDPVIKAVLKPKCLACGRFIPRLHHVHRFPFCSPAHGAVYVQHQQPLKLPGTVSA